MRIPSFATCLVLAGCATSSGLETNHESARDASQAAAGSTASAASSASGGSSKNHPAAPAVAVVREFEISEFAADDDVECRREAPLGSRISVERCYSTADGAETPAEAALDQIQRQEIENLRQQVWQEQQRMNREMAWRQRAVQSTR